MSTRILIADDHALVREGMRCLFRPTEFDVLGEASTCAEAVRLTGELPIDLVLLDLTWSCDEQDRGDGLEVLAQIKATRPDLPVVIFSACSRAPILERCRDLGASGFIVKSDGPASLLETLRRFARGDPLWEDAPEPETVPADAGLRRLPFVY